MDFKLHQTVVQVYIRIIEFSSEHSGNQKPFIRPNQMNTNLFLRTSRVCPFRFLSFITQT